MFKRVMLAAFLVLSTAAPALAAGAPEATTSCRKLPPGKRIVKLSLKPDTNVADLVAWISSVTCKQFILPGTIPATSKTVTIVSPRLLTPEEAYNLFLDALDSVGLTVYRTGAFYRVIESNKAIHSPIPVEVDPLPPQ
jgi:general secretion pathway protein D